MIPIVEDDVRDYLETILQGLPRNAANKLRSRLMANDTGNRWGAWSELVVHDWLERRGKDPEFEPEANGKTPDFRVASGGEVIFIEVFVTVQSRDDAGIDTTPIRKGSSVAVWWSGETRTYHSASSRIIQKLGKYKNLNKPYVICDVLATPIISPVDVKDLFQSWLLEDHDHVSALMVVEPKWTDVAMTYHFDCRLFPNPDAKYPISAATFADCLYLRTLFD